MTGMGHGVQGRVGPAELDAATARTVADTLQALATPSRLLILARLRQDPATVSALADAVGMEPSAVSHQLRLLRHLRLVHGERHGRSITYSLYDDHVAELLDQAVYHVEHLRLSARELPEQTG
jgi:DNA-binding transcriptional ArsR family regulator